MLDRLASDTRLMQQVPPQPAPGDMPVPPAPGPGGPPVIDPTRDPPPVEDPDVIDPTPGPFAPPPLVARRSARDVAPRLPRGGGNPGVWLALQFP